MGRLSSCANSKYETLISDKFYLRHVCTNSCSPGSGWRSQAFRSSRFSRRPSLSGSHPVPRPPGQTPGRRPPRLAFPCPAPSCRCAVLSPAPPPSGPAASPTPAESGRLRQELQPSRPLPFLGAFVFLAFHPLHPAPFLRGDSLAKCAPLANQGLGARSFGPVLVRKSSTEGRIVGVKSVGLGDRARFTS